MKTLKIKIPQGLEIDVEKSDIPEGVIVFREAEKKYPTSVEDINRPFYINSFGDVLYSSGGDKYISRISTKERAEAILALIQLVELRDAWNKIDEFEADWDNEFQEKYCIINRHGNVIKDECHFPFARVILAFGSEETRDSFFTTFRDLIVKAKELL